MGAGHTSIQRILGMAGFAGAVALGACDNKTRHVSDLPEPLSLGRNAAVQGAVGERMLPAPQTRNREIEPFRRRQCDREVVRVPKM